MRYLLVLTLLTGCANREPGEFDPPQRRADYAECQKTHGEAYPPAYAMYRLNDCMKAKGWQ